MKFIEIIDQGKNIISKLLETIPFIFTNKLWIGFFKQKLVLALIILLVIFVPWSLFEYIQAQFSSTDNITQKQGIAQAAMTQSLSFSSIFEGGNKYLVIALIQMLVVHFSNKTIEILSGVVIHLSIREMIQSQLRVFKLIIRNWILEIILGVGVVIILSIVNLDFLEDGFKYVLSCYFVGYFFLDNYNHTFSINIKKSAVIIRKHFMVAIIIGLVTKILFLLPFIGGLIASFICSVSATWYMHTSEDRHLGSEAFTS